MRLAVALWLMSGCALDSLFAEPSSLQQKGLLSDADVGIVAPTQPRPAFVITQVLDLGAQGRIEFPADVDREQIVEAIRTQRPGFKGKIPPTKYVVTETASGVTLALTADDDAPPTSAELANVFAKYKSGSSGASVSLTPGNPNGDHSKLRFDFERLFVAIYAVILGGLAVAVLWWIWRAQIASYITSLKTREPYLRSMCRYCCGPIEFPTHGVGEAIECPHCEKPIQLERMSTAKRFFVAARFWCGRQESKWKWVASSVAVVLICGTALYIYTDWRARSREMLAQAEAAQRANEDAEAARADLAEQQLEAQKESNRIAEERAQRAQAEAERVWDEEHPPGWRIHGTKSEQLAKRQLEETERANDIASDLAFQQRVQQIRRESQERTDQINRDYRARMAEINRTYSTPVLPPAPAIQVGSYSPASLANPYGAGSPYKADGLMNPYSQYGSPYSSTSWRNPYATDTPKLYDSQGNYRGKFSSNPYDPDSISNPYGKYGSPYSSYSVNNPYGFGSPYRTDPVWVVRPK